MVKVARVFLRKTQYTPTDDLCFFDRPGFLVPDVDEVHVSCLFTWDKSRAEWLAKQWSRVAPTKVGGPAYGKECGGGDDFTPGLYIRDGYVITSRGCIRRCPFCLVHSQEGCLREVPIHAGPWLMDNNLLACSRLHVERVFSMLSEQRGVKLLGGLDIRLVEDWHVDWLVKLKLKNVSIAYDMPDLEDAFVAAMHKLLRGISYGVVRCFVLAGFFEWDTPEKAEQRCQFVLKHGATPCAMYYRGPDEINPKRPKQWNEWTRRWSWQPGVYAMAKREGLETYQEKKKCK